MSQSLDQVFVHLIFSTRDRQPWLDDELRSPLYKYLATVVRKLGCACPRVGGMADHVHLAIQLSRTMTIAELVKEIKISSSKWIKSQSPELTEFSWQKGYGVFSVGPADLDALLQYIDQQEEHHKVRLFQDEYRAFLKKYGVVFDERYVWD